MSFSSWLLAGSVFILILAIVIGIGWWYRNWRIPTPAPPSPYDAPLVWGPPFPGPDTNKNFPQLYTFPSVVTNVQGVPTLVPGTPTYNPQLLNGLTGVSTFPQCLDPDQAMAMQLQHTCTAPNGVVDGAITRCFLLEGGTTGIGGTEIYYSAPPIPPYTKVPACAGVLSLISINFQIPGYTGTNGFQCIQNEGTGNNVKMTNCDPPENINAQLFRVTRIDPGQDPNSLQPGQGQNGLIAQIYDRNSGLCLMPGTSTSSTVYDPAYVGCKGDKQTFTGTNVIMGACTGGIYPGYVWIMLPSIPYCGLPGGCPGCTGCTPDVCFRCARDNACSNVVCDVGGACSGAETLITPPQIVYVGNLDITQIPVGPTGYAGLTGPSAVVKWLIDNNAQSLYYGGEGDQLILRRLGLDTGDTTDICAGGSESSCQTGDRAFIPQYMSISLYNTISNLTVCLAEQQGSCVNL